MSEIVDNSPELKPGLVFYYLAWQELSTDRQVGMGVGPIPGSSIRDMVRQYGMSTDDAHDFTTLVRAMDEAYLKWNADQSKAKRVKDA